MDSFEVGVPAWESDSAAPCDSLGISHAPAHETPSARLSIIRYEKDEKLSWEKAFLAPEMLSGSWELVASPCEGVPYAWTFPLLTEEACQQILELVTVPRNQKGWTSGRSARGYEVTEMAMSPESSLGKIYARILAHYVHPLVCAVSHNWSTPSSQIVPETTFTRTGEPDARAFVQPHHEEGSYVASVALSENGVDYSGGATCFPHEAQVFALPRGHALVHPAGMSHVVGTRPVHDGVKYDMVTRVRVQKREPVSAF